MPEPFVNHHEYRQRTGPRGRVDAERAVGGILLPPARRGDRTSRKAWAARPRCCPSGSCEGRATFDSRELLTALDNLGVSHSEGARSFHYERLRRDPRPEPDPRPRNLYADVLRRPHLDDEEVESIRAQAIQGLQGLEDDPGSKVVYELRKSSLPRPLRPSRSPGSPEGVRAATPDGLRAFHREAYYRPNGAILGVAGAIEWPALRRRPSADSSATGSPEARVRPNRLPARRPPARDHIAKETQQTQIALAYPTVTVRQPRLLPGPRDDQHPRRQLFEPDSSPRSERSGGSAIRSTPPITRARRTGRPSSATPGARPIGPRRRST